MTLMTRDAGLYAPQPLPAPPVLPYHAPTRATGAGWQKRIRLGDRYFLWLGLILLGYALGGRGFAYWGVAPLFVGEASLLFGVFVLLKLNVVGRLLNMRQFFPLILFMVWGAGCTIPYLDQYKKDAIRDAVLWGYGTYAFIVAGLLITNPIRVQKIVLYYRKFVIIFLILAPVSWAVCEFFEQSLPYFPGSTVPLIQVKGGDTCVHLGGAFAFIAALGSSIPFIIPTLLVPLNLGLNVQGRAGMVSFFVCCMMTLILRPFHPRAMRILFVLGLGLFFFWASDIRIDRGARELSFNQLIKGFGSIVGESDEAALSGTKEWRMRWWTDIIDYTFHGKHFWSGKGYGINLATDDGYQVEEEESLRSPHNGHMTVLARSGVPGFAIWVVVQLSWAFMIVRSYFLAWKHKHMNWSGLFMFLGAYWAAFMANTTFDVFLEGPMGGIWFWCIYGAGIGSAYLYRRYPDLLTPARPAMMPIQPPVSR